MRHRGNNSWLIVIEVVVLIVTIVVGMVFGVGRAIFKEQTIESNEVNNDINAVNTNISDVYKEGRMTFDDDIETKIAEMSIEQKVATMLLVTPSVLTGTPEVIVAGTTTQASLEAMPVAGLVLDKTNLIGKEDTKENIGRLMTYNDGYQVLAVVDASIADNGDVTTVEYLTETGVNSVILAPVIDQDADGYMNIISDAVKTYSDANKLAIVPFVPDQITNDDEVLTNYRTGFAKAVASAQAVMVTNSIAESITGDSVTPVSMSAVSTSKLRDEMGYTGLLITSDLSALEANGADMGNAAVSAVNAGMNVLYFSGNYQTGFDAIVSAVNSGLIDMNLIDNSVGRILSVRKVLQGGEPIHQPTEEELKALAEAQKAQEQANKQNNSRKTTNSNNNNNANSEPAAEQAPVEQAPVVEQVPVEQPAVDPPAEQPVGGQVPTIGDSAMGQAGVEVEQ